MWPASAEGVETPVVSELVLTTKILTVVLSGAADDDRYGNADNRVTVKEIHGYLDREMTYAARRQYGRDQQAMVYGDPGKVIVNLNR